MAKFPDTKTITRWYLEVNGSRVRFHSKKMAIDAGKAVVGLNQTVRLIEEYDLWGRGGETRSRPVLLDHQEFDRTFLIDPTIKPKNI